MNVLQSDVMRAKNRLVRCDSVSTPAVHRMLGVESSQVKSGRVGHCEVSSGTIAMGVAVVGAYL